MLANKQEAIVHYNLACYWSLAGDVDRALQYLAQSFDIDPRYRELVADEADFDPIRDLPDFQALGGAPSERAPCGAQTVRPRSAARRQDVLAA